MGKKMCKNCGKQMSCKCQIINANLAGLYARLFQYYNQLMAKKQKEELTLFDPDPGVPPSREVRLQDGVTHGDAERIAFQIYSGSAGDLAHSIVELELTMEFRKSRAVQAFADLVRAKLLEDGYIVLDDITKIERAWHESEVD